VACGGRNWTVDISCFGGPVALLSRIPAQALCSCDSPSFYASPCASLPNWGTADQATCTPPSQTISVLCR
jgi:hypothetical protein